MHEPLHHQYTVKQTNNDHQIHGIKKKNGFVYWINTTAIMQYLLLYS
jgi:hypothetical protein